jgi:large subunit ribosomal protein L28
VLRESLPVAQQCEVCGKKPALGNQMTHRGKAKYLGGVGTKVTGISRRKFRPNLQRVHVTTANGSRKTVRVCTQCIRSGAVVKRVRHSPFTLPKTPEVK